MNTLASLPPFPILLPLGIAAKRLDASDVADVTTFCRQCSAFFALVADHSPPAETARYLLESRPPGVELTHKHLIGFERGGEVIAIVDLLKGYPGEADWYVGLLIISPDERARGLGTAVWNAVEAWIRSEGGRHVRLIVQEQNPEAARFWRSVGFTDDRKVEQRLATRTNICWSFEKALRVPSPLADAH